jgi:hypothetical protein
MQHIMLDLETFGTKPGCALRSIGAVAFDLDGTIGEEFYLNIDRQSCLDAGLTIDPDTLAWWERQSPEAQAALLVDPHPLAGVVAGFHAWFKQQGGVFVWSHGGNFDEPIWCAAALAVGVRVPWKFWNARCTRTAYHLTDFDPRSIPRQGTYHNARDDARYQARCVIEALRRPLLAQAAAQ